MVRPVVGRWGGRVRVGGGVLAGLALAGCSGGSGGPGADGGGVGDAGPGLQDGAPGAPGQGRFPASAPWYRDVSGAALDRESAAIIAGLQARGGWGTGAVQIDFSIEVLQAPVGLAGRAFEPTDDFFEPDCDQLPVPLPPGGRLEGERDYSCADDGDCHLIVVQGTRLYEMWRANITGGQAAGGVFTGGCLAVWDLQRDYWQGAATSVGYARGDQCSSADAAGFPIAELLFDADEVKAGEIRHAVRFILPNDRIRKGEFVRPATHSGAGRGTPSSDTVPYGARFRLRAGFDVSRLPSAGARVVARALQRYGMFLADGGNIALTGRSDSQTTTKWTGLLGPRDLAMLKVSDFEVIDAGPRIPLTLDCRRQAL
jgi:hypothetical protein